MPTPIENADCIDTLVDHAVNDTSHAFLVDAAVRMNSVGATGRIPVRGVFGVNNSSMGLLCAARYPCD
jgi:hypothetical protein